VKPEMVKLPEIPQYLYKTKERGVMGVMLAHFNMQFVKIGRVTKSFYNIAANCQRCLKGLKPRENRLIP